jgi:hypothetical protein
VTDPDRSVETSRAVLAHLAVHDFPTRSPLYAAIARAALDDDEVLGLTAGVRGHELPPMLLRPAWVGEGIESGAVDCALIRLSLLTATGREDRWLARGSYHGEWIEWREPQTR